MIIIKRCFLYGLMFGSFSLLAMGSQALSVNATVSHFNNSANNSFSNVEQRAPFYNSMKSNLPSKDTSFDSKQKKIRSPLLTQAQERNNILLNEIRDKIDVNHLGIDTDIWLRGIRGVYNSYYKIHYLTGQQMIDEMYTIEAYISRADKESMLKKLEEKHWYVNMLLRYTVDAKFKEIPKVKGTTIDAVTHIPKRNGFKRMVHDRALKQYFAQWGIDWPLSVSALGGLNDIHATVLYGSQDKLNRDTLAMSSDNKYLRGVDYGGNEIIWDMEQGITTRLTTRDVVRGGIKWIYEPSSKLGDSYYLYDKMDNYLAVLMGEEDIRHAAYWGKDLGGLKGRVIMLFKRSQKISYLCQRAFDNSVGDRKELIALLNSKSLAAIDGFPKENLKQLITERLT